MPSRRIKLLFYSGLCSYFLMKDQTLIFAYMKKSFEMSLFRKMLGTLRGSIQDVVKEPCICYYLTYDNI